MSESISKDIVALPEELSLLSPQQKYSKQYYLAHKDQKNANTRQYYSEHQEKLKAYSVVQHVEYYREHKEEILAKVSQYYHDNIQIITEKKKERFDCSCGGKYTAVNKAQHQKTNKHIKSLELA